jgi:hypothetical protein
MVVVGAAVAAAMVGLVLVIRGTVLDAAVMALAGVTISAVTIVAHIGSQES